MPVRHTPEFRILRGDFEVFVPKSREFATVGMKFGVEE